MTSTINYSTVSTSIRTAVPFTWGLKIDWAIKSPGGVIFYLQDGESVKLSEYELLQQPNLTYATALNIK